MAGPWPAMAWALALGAIGCGRRTSPVTATAMSTAAPAATTAPPATSPEAAASGPVAKSAGSAPRGVPCGDLACAQFDSAKDAFLEALAGDPLVVGIGEAHAPRGARVPSAARRFTEDLLPAVAGRASDLLLELMMPPSGCVDAAAEVRAKQQPVTSRQADTNRSEYVEMGDRARALGMVPDLLRPSCNDLAGMRGDRGDAISASLETIARLTASQAEKLIVRDARSDADRGKMVLLYGGALHNDLDPRPEAERWTYAPELDHFVQGRFVAVDLVVPEFIGDDEAWRSLPWRPAYDEKRLGEKTTLFRIGERSFVLVFARTH